MATKLSVSTALTTWGELLPVRDLSDARRYRFDISPEADALPELARELEFSAVKKLRFQGELSPIGKKDWLVKANLGATIVQPCVATLGPVTTRIDIEVERHFLSALKPVEQADDDDEEGIEMTEDERIEPLPAEIMLCDIALEALSLAAPDYPRAQDAASVDTRVTAPGATPMSDEETKPFAGLKALLDTENPSE